VRSVFAIELNPFNDIAGWVGGAVSDAAGAVLDKTVQFIFGLIVGAVTGVTDGLISLMNATSGIDFGTDLASVSDLRSMVLGMSMLMILGSLFMSIMGSLAAGEPGKIVRSVFVDVPGAVFFTMLFIVFLDKLLELVDLASVAAMGDVGDSLGQVAAALVIGNTVTGVGDAGFLSLIFGILYIFGALMVWAELLIRSALIFIMVVLAPLGYAMRANPSTKRIARRTSEVLVALVLSKFGIAVAFGVGARLIDAAIETPGEGAGTGADISAMFIGTTVVVLAAFMPWMLLKMIPVMEAATAMQGAERGPMRTAGTAVAAVGAVAGIKALAGASAASGGAGVGGGSARAATSGGGQPGPAPGGPAGGGSGGGGSSGGGGPSAPPGGGQSAALRSTGGASIAANSAPSAPASGSSNPGDGSGVEVVSVGAPRAGVLSVPAAPVASAPTTGSPNGTAPAASTASVSSTRGGAPLGSSPSPQTEDEARSL